MTSFNMQHLDPSQGTSRHPSLEQPFQNHGQSLFPKGTTTSCECLSNIQQLCFPFASARRDSKSGSRSGYSSPRLGSAMPCAKSHWICLWLHRGGGCIALVLQAAVGEPGRFQPRSWRIRIFMQILYTKHSPRA